MVLKMTLRKLIYDQVEPEKNARKGLSPINWFLVFLILLSLVLYTAETENRLGENVTSTLSLWNTIILFVFLVEFALRFWVAGVDEEYRGLRGLRAYTRRNWRMVSVDFAAFGPELFCIVVGFPAPSWLRALRVLRLLKMARYVAAFELVLDALRSCVQELLVALSLSFVLWYVASVVLYLCEHDVKPEWFGSITRSMWWSVITLTTVGYGDVYPITVAGKITAGIIAVIGLGTAALPSGIIAGAFIDKYRERR